MSPSTRNIIIFVGIAAALTAIYVFFIKSPEQAGNLVSSLSTSLATTKDTLTTKTTGGQDNTVAQNFLSLLLNVKNIKLDTSIFSDSALNTLHDSSILLIPDGNEGRPNPFAQFGSDNSSTSSAASAPIIPQSGFGAGTE